MSRKPSSENQEISNLEKQFDQVEQNIKDMTLDKMNQAPVKETEEPKISSKELEKTPDFYVKPQRSIMSKEKFNEKFRESWNYAKEYIQRVVNHNEIKGDVLEFWTKPFPGVPAEYWVIPSGKVVFIPRYVDEQINSCQYHRLRTEDRPTQTDGGMTYFGSMIVDTTIQRLESKSVNTNRSFSMHRKIA